MLQVQLPTCTLCHCLLSQLGLRLVLHNTLSFLQHRVSRAWAQALTTLWYLSALNQSQYVQQLRLLQYIQIEVIYCFYRVGPHQRWTGLGKVWVSRNLIMPFNRRMQNPQSSCLSGEPSLRRFSMSCDSSFSFSELSIRTAYNLLLE
jgi:hypothetical protein